MASHLAILELTLLTMLIMLIMETLQIIGTNYFSERDDSH